MKSTHLCFHPKSEYINKKNMKLIYKNKCLFYDFYCDAKDIITLSITYAVVYVVDICGVGT